jgi:CheY-like chemotaxis protein
MDVARFRILVVDDYVDATDSTVELLTIWGYDAIACYTGAAALESACLHRPDVVVLELAMPQMDGFKFTGLFHELSDCVSVPLVAMSGNSSQAYRARAWESGIRHYLLKPTCLKCLKDLLASEIERCNVPLPAVEMQPLPIDLSSESHEWIRPRYIAAPEHLQLTL